MKKIAKKTTNLFIKYKSIILYLIFGVLTTLINIIIYATFTKLFNIDYLISNLIAWILAVTFAFITNKFYVFESKTTEKKVFLKELYSFFIARIISLLIDMVIMFIFVSIFKFNDMIIKIFSNIIVIILNYLFSKLFIFKKNT